MRSERARSQQRRRGTGYTLAELLIAVAIGSVVIAGVSRLLVSETKLGRTQLRTQQLRSGWSRFTYFLAHEVGEGSQVQTNTTAATLSADGCSLPSGGTLLFSVVIPIATDSGVPVSRNVHYYTTGSDSSTVLFRCGPPVLSSGRLNTTATMAAARLLTGVPLAASVDADQVSVTITPTSPGAEIGAFAVRTRSIVIP